MDFWNWTTEFVALLPWPWEFISGKYTAGVIGREASCIQTSPPFFWMGLVVGHVLRVLHIFNDQMKLVYQHSICWYPPWNPWKWTVSNRNLLFQWVIFRFYMVFTVFFHVYTVLFWESARCRQKAPAYCWAHFILPNHQFLVWTVRFRERASV